MSWPQDDPGAGAFEGLREFTQSLHKQREAVQSISATLRTARSQRYDVWTGTAAEAWSTKLSKLDKTVAPLDDAFQQMIQASNAYEDAVVAIKTEVGPVLELKDWAQRERQLLNKNTDRTDLSEQAIEEVQARAATLRRTENEVERRLLELAKRRREADSDAEQRIRSSHATITQIRQALKSDGRASIGSKRLPVEKNPKKMTLADLRRLTADQLDDLPPAELRELANRLSNNPEAAAEWWDRLTPEQQERLIKHAPELIGLLDGVAPDARVAANKEVAAGQYEANEERIRELEKLPYSLDIGTRTGRQGEIDALKLENSYLKKAKNGEIQLYTYDRGADRLVEMIGDPQTATQQFTFIPGTDSNFSGFFNGTTQGLASRVAESVPGTLAFVCKDGPYPKFPPWDDRFTGSASVTAELGQRQARLQAGIDAAGYGALPNTAVGHSAGLAILTSSETAGAGYDNVVSLSGIGMNDQWSPNPGTSYYDYTTERDFILPLRGIDTGGDWGYPLEPNRENGFTVLDSGIETKWTNPFGGHSQIASEDSSTQVRDGLADLLRGMRPAGA
ncbi:hypothetical protein [Lysinibacter cavernae]|uniref:Uncharacterized protein YukE n=1 Tax=Lysinibacter cavernae TaxID=1640652 RepID=A0A7X5TTA9_9MICO|nr:hypothetical protein [Lysinibacter cavernae]NIH53980.1 uncharacterized protein YukE [Lysinibacter cavernae]